MPSKTEIYSELPGFASLRDLSGFASSLRGHPEKKERDSGSKYFNFSFEFTHFLLGVSYRLHCTAAPVHFIVQALAAAGEGGKTRRQLRIALVLCHTKNAAHLAAHTRRQRHERTSPFKKTVGKFLMVFKV